MGYAEDWDRAALRYQAEFDPPTDVVHYGPALPPDTELRLVPHGLNGRRVLELGCGAGQAAAAFTALGARTIAVDASPEMLALAHGVAERAGAKVDFRLGDLCELAFVPAESVELVFCAATLDYVEDLDRVVRSVHRVLRPGGTFLFTLEHPFSQCVEADGPHDDRPSVVRSYADAGPVKAERYGETFLVYPRTVAEVVALLSRGRFRLDAMAEPVAPDARVPSGSVWRARKDGR